jgi:hypothetical protein
MDVRQGVLEGGQRKTGTANNSPLNEGDLAE